MEAATAGGMRDEDKHTQPLVAAECVVFRKVRVCTFDCLLSEVGAVEGWILSKITDGRAARMDEAIQTPHSEGITDLPGLSSSPTNSS